MHADDGALDGLGGLSLRQALAEMQALAWGPRAFQFVNGQLAHDAASPS
jgi:hypothetical protein